MSLEEVKIPSVVVFVIGKEEVSFSINSLKGILQDSFLDILATSPAAISAQTGGKIVIEEKIDPLYLRAIADWATEQNIEDLPWTNLDFSLSKLCSIADKWNITHLQKAIGCTLVPAKKRNESIKYVLKQMPYYIGDEDEPESGTVMLFGRIFRFTFIDHPLDIVNGRIQAK